MKIIFLDIDGVLNNEIMEVKNKAWALDKRCIKLLNLLIAETSAKVVVTSAWRLGKTVDELQEILNEHGFTGNIIGVTPNLITYSAAATIVRGNEIKQWIFSNQELIGTYSFNFDSYVILDDDCDMLLEQKDNFIHVDSYCGLTPNVIDRARRILDKTKGEK